jgi:hypothetical protein
MKNIHILPTDKPSRLYLHSNNELQLRTNIIRSSEDYLGTNQNMFITSDEEIKVEDWVIEFQKGDDIGEVQFINSEYVIAGDIQKKIILTTNQDLINDGVQSIDDEFLEWFVKNPSCDEVDVFYKDVYSLSNWDRRYKIIIPQEEPKQEYKYIGECKGSNDNGCFMESLGHDCGCFERIQKEEPKQLTDLEIAMKLEEIEREDFKQETLEEEAEKYSRAVWGVYYDDVHPDIAITQTQGEISVKDFSRGAKWQARRMYSEEEVLEIIRQYALEEHLITSSKPDIWFKQYKKK